MVDWPKNEDRLFANGSVRPKRLRALAVMQPSSRRSRDAWYPFIDGYRTAAIKLGDQLIEEDRSPDTLVYPLVFNWRHCIELQLKYVIFVLGNTTPTIHDLARLANRANELLLESKDAIMSFGSMTEHELRQPLRAMRDWCSEFQEIDKASDGFRYPFGTDGGASSLPATLRHLDIDNFQEQAKRLSNFLADVIMAVEIIEEHEAEMDAEWREIQAEQIAEIEADLARDYGHEY